MDIHIFKKDAHSNTHAHRHIQTHCHFFDTEFLLNLTPRQTVLESISNFSEAGSLEGFSTKTGIHPSFPLSFPLRSLPLLNCQPFRLQYTLLNFAEPDPGQPRTVLFSLTADMKTFTTKMHDNNEVHRMNYLYSYADAYMYHNERLC